AQRVFLKVLFLEHIQNGESRSACDRIASKSAEEFHAVVETRGDFWSGDDGRERERISDGFSEHHDVWNNVLRFESPEMRAETAKPDLPFIGDADAACSADVLVSFREISRGKNNLTRDTR